MGGSETTTTKTAPLSAQGEEWNSMFKSMLQATLDEAGFDMAPEEVTKSSDPSKSADLTKRISNYDKRIADLQTKINSTPPARYTGGPRISADEQQLRSLQLQRDALEKDLNKIPSVTFTKWDVKKREDVRVVDAIEKYGEDSPETRAIRAEVKQEDVQKQASLKGIEADYLKSMKKFVNGDFSYTPEQAAQAEIYTAPIKNIINTTTDELLATAGDNADKLQIGLDNLLNEIDKTGFAVEDALKAAEIQIDKSGGTMLDALRTANKSSLDRARFQFDLLSEDIDKKAAQTSALLGLPPGSMAEQVQKAKMKNDALRQLELEANERETLGELGISQMTEEGKQRISLSRVALAESQGAKREGVGQSRIAIDENLGNTKLSIGTARANALLGAEQQKQALLQGMAYGNVPSMLGIAQGGLGFDAQQNAGELAFGQQAMSPVANQLGIEQQRTFAETTSKTKKSPGFLDIFSDVVGIGAGGAGSILSGIG